VVSGQWSVVSGQWSVVSGQWSVVSGQWSVVSGQWSVVSGLVCKQEAATAAARHGPPAWAAHPAGPAGAWAAHPAFGRGAVHATSRLHSGEGLSSPRPPRCRHAQRASATGWIDSQQGGGFQPAAARSRSQADLENWPRRTLPERSLNVPTWRTWLRRTPARAAGMPPSRSSRATAGAGGREPLGSHESAITSRRCRRGARTPGRWRGRRS
jgi:hypothetical protein